MKIPVSVVILTRNEAANMAASLSGLDRFAEVFVVDSESDDGTPDIASSWGAHVVDFRWNGRYPKKKQWSLDSLPFSCDRVFFLDADERATPSLIDEIAALFAEDAAPLCAGYFVEGRHHFLGKALRFGQRNFKLALVDRRRAHFPEIPDLDVSAMWEVEGHYQPVVEGPVGRLRGCVEHADNKPLYDWFARHNRYSDWEAALRADDRMEALIAQEGAMRRRWLKRLFARLPARPLAAFLYGYIWKLGFLDGAAGFHFALARAFYYWQIDVKIRAIVLDSHK
ncbi:(heptosyl)LPS beta-1,4-glucosyltransferase [Azospirillaceae bacterium]